MRGRTAMWALAIPALACAGPTGVPEAEWLEAKTPHFVIWSALGADGTRELARELELFRALVERTTGGTPVDPRLPTYIYAFGSNRSFAPFSFAGRAVGFFSPSMRDNRVALNARYSRGHMDGKAILKHEYVHFLLRNSGTHYPAWYHEGFAEFLATSRIGAETVEVGHVPKWRLRSFGTLHWIPIGRVLGADPWELQRQEMSTFYTESWALVHYLHFGRKEKRKVAQDLRTYLGATADGLSVREAVKPAFGLWIDELNQRVRRYVTKGAYPYVAVQLDGSFDAAVSVEPMAPGEAAEELGWLSLAIEKPGQARSFFEGARAAGRDGPRIQVGLALAAHRLDEPEPARAGFEAALAAAPDDAFCHLDYARYLHDLAERADEEGDADARAARLSEARRHYVSSWTLDNSIPETYAMYGASFLFDGEPASKGVETLEHAHRLLRSNLEIRLLLARAYAAVQRRYEAHELALTVAGWSHDEEQQEEAAALARELEEGGGLEPPEPEPL